VLSQVQRAQVRDAIRDQLESQARALAVSVSRQGPAVAAQSQNLLAGTTIIVQIRGQVSFASVPLRRRDVRGTASIEDPRRGTIVVALERDEPRNLVNAWLLPALFAIGAVASGVVIWLLAGRLARRLRGSIADLTTAAEAVEAGDLSVRAAEGDGLELESLARAFNDMTARLEGAEQRQRAFLADVAHELRTPVTAIEGFAGALRDGTASTPEDREEAAEFIRDEAARLRLLVRDLQQLTWLDLDPPVRPREVDLAELGRTSAARFAAEAERRGVTLSASAEPVMARTDPAHVLTILSNLVENALRYTPAGGTVRIAVQRQGPEAVLSVADTGRGIAAEHLPYLFDRLYRVDAARDRAAGGSGLGLAIVRRLATLLGGRVAVTSAVGTGSTFTVRLPARVAAPRPPGGVRRRSGVGPVPPA
jgi:signal transduction histidine kinase